LCHFGIAIGPSDLLSCFYIKKRDQQLKTFYAIVKASVIVKTAASLRVGSFSSNIGINRSGWRFCQPI
jgi:hypothetical protein